MRSTMIFGALLACMGPARAQVTTNLPESVLIVQTGQLSRLGGLIHLKKDCQSFGYVKIQVVVPPTNGFVLTKRLRGEYSSYDASSELSRCNSMKHPSLEILYKSRMNFKGVDHFTIEWPQENGAPIYKPYTIRVE